MAAYGSSDGLQVMQGLGIVADDDIYLIAVFQVFTITAREIVFPDGTSPYRAEGIAIDGFDSVPAATGAIDHPWSDINAVQLGPFGSNLPAEGIVIIHGGDVCFAFPAI